MNQGSMIHGGWICLVALSLLGKGIILVGAVSRVGGILN